MFSSVMLFTSPPALKSLRRKRSCPQGSVLLIEVYESVCRPKAKGSSSAKAVDGVNAPRYLTFSKSDHPSSPTKKFNLTAEVIYSSVRSQRITPEWGMEKLQWWRVMKAENKAPRTEVEMAKCVFQPSDSSKDLGPDSWKCPKKVFS